MRVLSFIAVLAAAALLTACEPDRYPITGQECGPDDPVRALDGSDCVSIPAGSGTF
jgi:hypothetical protein